MSSHSWRCFCLTEKGQNPNEENYIVFAPKINIQIIVQLYLEPNKTFSIGSNNANICKEY